MKKLTCTACFDPVYELENGAGTIPAKLEVTTRCPYPWSLKYLSARRDSDNTENTFKLNTCLSTSISIVSQTALWDRPALLTNISNCNKINKYS